MKPWYAERGPSAGKLKVTHSAYNIYEQNHKRPQRLQTGINLREPMYRHLYKPPPR